jgi:hypothetical protein
VNHNTMELRSRSKPFVDSEFKDPMTDHKARAARTVAGGESLGLMWHAVNITVVPPTVPQTPWIEKSAALALPPSPPPPGPASVVGLSLPTDSSSTVGGKRGREDAGGEETADAEAVATTAPSVRELEEARDAAAKLAVRDYSLQCDWEAAEAVLAECRPSSQHYKTVKQAADAAFVRAAASAAEASRARSHVAELEEAMSIAPARGSSGGGGGGGAGNGGGSGGGGGRPAAKKKRLPASQSAGDDADDDVDGLSAGGPASGLDGEGGDSRRGTGRAAAPASKLSSAHALTAKPQSPAAVVRPASTPAAKDSTVRSSSSSPAAGGVEPHVGTDSKDGGGAGGESSAHSGYAAVLRDALLHPHVDNLETVTKFSDQAGASKLIETGASTAVAMASLVIRTAHASDIKRRPDDQDRLVKQNKTNANT